MLKVITTTSEAPAGEALALSATLDDLARDGARRMIAAALQLEAAEYIARFREARDANGHALVVRNGTARPRAVTTGVGPLTIAAPRVNDQRVVDGVRQKFTSVILPPYIRDSVAKVDGGTALVNQSGQTLEEILGAVRPVTDLVAEIAAASQGQSAGIDQVNRAVTQMDEVTQQNAAKTQELSATAQDLAGQAHHLQQLVGRFTLARGVHRDDAPVAPPPAHALHEPAPPPRVMRAKSRRTPEREQTRRPIHASNGSAHGTNGSALSRDDAFDEF